MGIGTALNTGVLGLRAQSQALQATSNNVANAETVGYKRAGTSFESVAVGGRGQGVNAHSERAVTEQGTIEQTGKTTDFAVDGDGFMVVGQGSNDDRTDLTRAGSFTPDAAGYLRNAQGQYLKGVNLRNLEPGAQEPDLSAGNLEAVNISGINYQPAATGDGNTSTADITFKGNLPRSPGGSAPFKTEVSYVTATGASKELTLSWENPGSNSYELHVIAPDGDEIGSAAVNFHDGTTSEARGALKDITGASSSSGGATFNALGDGMIEFKSDSTGAKGVTLDLGTPADAANDVAGMNGVTMLDGGYTVTNITSDGAAFSTVEKVKLGDNGLLQAVFKNGDTQDLYRIPVATVNSPNELQAIGEQTFRAGPESGELTLNTPGQGAGKLIGGALEQSNVDLSAELTDLIVTQRNYSANGSAVRTADQMLQRTVQLKR
jgi:flagellar hook protein FlgE